MKFYRSERVSKLVREELSKIIERELEFDALVTVTEVDVDKKMDRARVLVSVLPAKGEAAALRTLANAAGYLQHLLVKKVNIKPMPRIMFEIDRGPENAARVEKALLGE
jgi:ribosome-binding factor A